MLESVEKKQPRRNVGAQFTTNVLDTIERTNQKESLFMKFAHKPMLATAAVGTLLVMGTGAYAAAANWPTIQSFFGGEQTLSTGNRIVGVKTDGCRVADDTPGAADNMHYYEIRKDSPLTNDQVVAMVQGECEDDLVAKQSNVLAQEILKSKSPGESFYSSSFLTIEQINNGSITVVADTSHQGVVVSSPTTYNVATDVHVMDGSATIQYSDLKVGDTVTLFNVDERGISTEKQGYTQDLSAIHVKAILKTPTSTGNASLFYKDLGKEFVRVIPQKDGSFKRAYEFDK